METLQRASFKNLCQKKNVADKGNPQKRQHFY